MDPQQTNHQEQTQQQPKKEIRLNQQTISIASAALGLLAVIFLFFPDLKLLTILFSIVGLGLGIYLRFQGRSIFTLLGIILSAAPLLFFLNLELIEIYFANLLGIDQFEDAFRLFR